MKTEAYINTHKKSHFDSAALTIFFGPLGVMYSHMGGGILLTIAALLLSWTIIVPVGIWIASPLVGASCVADHNRKLRAKAEMIASGGFLEA